jgi:hypothetical protein
MDYEKEYKELVGKIEKAYLFAQTDSTRAVLEEIRSELRESEDEEVRKAMIDFFKHEREEGIAVLHYGVDIERMIAWLEKRGEQKPAWKPTGEQMKFLWKYAEQNNYDGMILTSLFNDLKKLREG